MRCRYGYSARHTEWRRSLLAVVAGLGLVGCTFAGTALSPAPTEPPPAVVLPTATPAVQAPTFTVQRGEVVSLLTLDGRVAPQNDTDLFFSGAGLLKAVYVAAGDTVTQGQVLAELDAEQLQEQIVDLQLEIDTNARRLTETRQQKDVAIRNAQLSLADARGRLEALRRPAEQVDVESARVALEQARIALDGARRTLSLAKSQARTAMEKAANDLRTKQEDYSLLLTGPGEAGKSAAEAEVDRERARRAVEEAGAAMDIAIAAYDSAQRAEVEGIAEAEQALRLAQARYDDVFTGPDRLELAQAERDVQRAEVALGAVTSSDDTIDVEQRTAQARRSLEKLQAQIEQTRLLAPFDGVVAEVYHDPGEKLEELAPVVTLYDPSKVDLLVREVPPAALVKLSPGMPADVSFGAGGPVVGRVTVVPGPENAGATAIRLAFDTAAASAQVGDAATVTLVVERAPDALWLPPAAVRSFDTQRFVVVKDGATERQVDVEVGIETPDRVQIVSGLTEGQEVLGPLQ